MGTRLLLAPVLLMQWARRANNNWGIAAYGLVVSANIIFFGIIDGFMDHVLKALGVQHTTILQGSDLEFVHTAMSLWSPRASNLFYEGTSVLTAIASLFAAYFLFRFVRPQSL